ncbi:hypothetical protein [Oceanospirillum beijerinckii]|uniref:hypothetical protein n=1 Tax=Oceanospirillum beijerinckii TaxID=64976 RepID=UPI0004012F83|nr:hypothetical protein [Oceanospirillum beijerinckii]
MDNLNTGSTSIFVKDVATWEMLWQRAVAYYWSNYQEITETVSSEDVLWHVLKSLNVINAVNEGNGIVAFTSEPGGNGHKIVEITVNDGSSFPLPKYDVSDAYRPINGWENLSVGLTIRIPKKPTDKSQAVEVLSQFVQLGMYYPFGQAVSGAFATESVQAVQPAMLDSQVGDRTGVEEVDADYDWIQFVPRLAAYIWGNESFNQETLNLNVNLNKELTNSLGYVVSEGLVVNGEYAAEAPVVNGQFNHNAYVSRVTVEFPAPPELEQPMALADLIAKGANNPFTSS